MANNDCEDDIGIIEKESDEFFLDLIKERPCLYDKTSKDYHDKIVTENAMEDIAYIMNDTVSNCELKWKKFQAAYTKEKLLQEKESRSGAPASNRKPWPYFTIMHSFVSPKGIPRNCYSHVARKDSDEKIMRSLKPNKSKRQNVNLVEHTLNNVQSAINELKELKTINLVNPIPQTHEDNLEVMVGNIIKIQLSKLSPKLAKRKRKLIMQCLIEEDSDSDI